MTQKHYILKILFEIMSLRGNLYKRVNVLIQSLTTLITSSLLLMLGIPKSLSFLLNLKFNNSGKAFTVPTNSYISHSLSIELQGH